MEPSPIIRAAVTADIPALHALVESAYRGDAARAGWTHEADLLGGQRTDPAALAGVLADPACCILIAATDAGPVGCVQVTRIAADRCALGLLAVRPGAQGGGLGRALIAAAEAVARERFAATAMEMTVLRQRPELIEWYVRRGYVPTGESRPFPIHDERFGIARDPALAFVVLQRPLTEQDPPGVKPDGS